METALKKTSTRQSLSVGQKLKIKEYYETHKDLSQIELREWIEREFGVVIGRSTISKLLKERINIITNLESRRVRPSKYPHLEEKLLEFIKEFKKGEKRKVTDEIIYEQAKRIRAEGPSEEKECKLSNGWICTFKKRNGIHFREKIEKIQENSNISDFVPPISSSLDLEEEKMKDEHEILHEEKHEKISAPEDLLEPSKFINELIQLYKPENVFCMETMHLLYRLIPKSRLVKQDIPGTKKSKERMIIGLCTNVTGNEKINPFIIAKYGKPRCFKNVNLSKIPMNFYANKQANMTNKVYGKWLKDFNARMSDRKVVLLINNTSYQEVINLSNVKVILWLSKIVSVFQPMHRGIIHLFKINYRLKYLQWIADHMELESRKILDLLTSVHFIIDAWNEIPSYSIRNCWITAGLCEETLSKRYIKDIEETEKRDIRNMSNLISQLNYISPMDAKTYVTIEDTIFANEQVIVEDESDEESEAEAILTNSEAIISLERVKIFMQSVGCFEPKEIRMIKKIQQKCRKKTVVV